MNYSLLLFDLDETLLRSAWFEIGLEKTLARHHLTKDLDPSIFFEKKLTVPNSIIQQFKNGELTPKDMRRERWRHACSHFGLDPDLETIDELDALFLENGMACIEIDRELIELMTELSTRYQLGIVTNALYDPRRKIAQMGLSNVFAENEIIDAEKIGFRKPASDIYKAALKHFQKEPSETLFIGDSWIHDVAGPMDVGIDAVWLNRKGQTPTSQHQPFAVVSDLFEIRSILLRD